MQLFFDIEFCRESNPFVDGAQMMACFMELLVNFCRRVLGPSGGALQKDDFVELDSTTAEKFSRHLIARPGWMGAPRATTSADERVERTVTFANIREVGAFANALMDYARTGAARESLPDLDILLVHKPGDGMGSCVDLSVYTANRPFRLLHSSKFTVGVPLRIVRPSEGGRRIRDESAAVCYLRSLASFVPPQSNVLPPRLLSNVSGVTPQLPPLSTTVSGMVSRISAPPATFAAPPSEQRLEAFLRGFWAEVDRRYQSGEPAFDEVAARAAGLRAADEAAARRNGAGELVSLPGGFVLRLHVGPLFCGNRGRRHRHGNGVKLLVDVRQGRFWQMCYDPDCGLYRSPSFEVPAGLLPVEPGPRLA